MRISKFRPDFQVARAKIDCFARMHMQKNYLFCLFHLQIWTSLSHLFNYLYPTKP